MGNGWQLMLTDPHVIRWSDEHVRTICDAYVRLLTRIEAAHHTFWSQGIATRLGADDAEVLGDGSDRDGRPPLTVGQVRTLLSQAFALRDAAEANEGAQRNVFYSGAVVT